eukprot:scaffold25994_cov40-Attheya_sp.AAC.6
MVETVLEEPTAPKEAQESQRRRSTRKKWNTPPVDPNGTMDNFLHTEFYLTSKKAKDAGMVPSPYVFMGRPNVPAIFAKMKKSALAQGESRVAVCVCGPSPLVSACREASRQQSGGGVTFDFHYETFEF